MAYLGSHTGHGTDHSARLLISCPDGPGIVAAVSRFLFEQGANIVTSDQYSTHPEHGTFFMRSTFYLPSIDADRSAFEAAFGALAERFGMQWRISYASELRRVALMASRADHCLVDLLWRNRRGELDMDVACVISNHDVVRDEVERLGVRFLHIPVTPETKPQAEDRALEVLAGAVDLLVLARYMQILSPSFLERLGCPVINIHHSFLPGFKGAKPYHQAYDRGVKVIGATAHYVTHDLDEGPIIEQIVERVDHGYTPEMLVAAGRDSERRALSAAVRYAIEQRVFLNGGRTVVFK